MTASSDCRAVELSLGVLVLGALEPQEREQVEGHLHSCAGCSTLLAEIAPLPGLLNRIDPSVLDTTPPPAAILEKALEEVRDSSRGSERSRRRVPRQRTAWILAAAAVTLLILGLAGAKSAQVFPFAAPADVVASATNPVNGVSATVTVKPSESGSHVLLALNGVSPGAQCQLVAVGKDGQREIAATWVASYEGEAHVAGVTGLPADQIASFDIATPQGVTLVSIPFTT